MRNYIYADIRRILQRFSHTFSMFLLFAIYVIVLYFPNRGPQVTSVTLASSACGIMDWLPIFIGLFEMIAVFSEDFQVKTMQVAIGLGVSRTQVVLCKLIEFAILLVFDIIVFTGLTMLTGALLSISFPMAILMDVVITLLIKVLLACVTYLSLTMPVLFITHSSILSIFVFTLISAGTVNMLLSILPMFGINWFEGLNLNRITLGHFVSAFYSRAMLGTLDALSLLGIAAYLGLGVYLTCNMFSKRELDF